MEKIKSFFKNYIDWDAIFSLLFLVAVIGSIVYIINSKNTSSNTTNTSSANTSYSVEQKKKNIKLDDNNTSNTNSKKNEVDKSELNNNEEFECDYILNKNTRKFHYPWCSSVNNMKTSNTKEYNGTRDEVIDMGYSPCGRCNP